MDVIIAEGLKKSFGDERVLDDISLRIRRGEAAGLAGPNGCGKTTLLKIISGLLDPDEGFLEVRGRAALVFQDNLLLPWLTVRENISLGLKIRGVPDQYVRERVSIIAEMLGLSDHLDKYPSRISGGTARKASIARALILEPDILLLDEPYAGLDENSIISLQGILGKLKGRVTMIIVSHQLEELTGIVQRIYVLSHRPARVKKVIHTTTTEKG